MTVIRMALAQMEPAPRDIATGYRRVHELLSRATSEGASWLLLPELFLGGYELQDLEPLALPADAPELDSLARSASRAGLGFQTGFIERAGAVIYDSVLTVTPSGDRLIYRKTHLFGLETTAFAPGDRLPILDVGDYRVAPLICYDLEFPEPVRVAACNGASLVLVSTANMSEYAELQRIFAQSRALENQVFVAICNRVGKEAGFHFGGGSIVTDPFGRILAQAGTTEAFLVVDCDLDQITAARQSNHYLNDRRPRLYEALTESPAIVR